jgi:hypothetical protein
LIIVPIQCEAFLLVTHFLGFLRFSTRTNEEVLLFTCECFAFGEALFGAFVGFANVDFSSECQLLLCQLGEIFFIALGLFFGFTHTILTYDTIGSIGKGRISGVGVGGETGFVLDFSLCNGFTSVFIRPFRVAVVSAPTVSSLFLLVAVEGWISRGK